MPNRLDELAQPFRATYLDHAQIEQQLNAWTAAFPSIIRTEVAGVTTEGRKIHVAVIGPQPDRLRPSVWIDANMHASELCGTSVALAIAEDFLRLHLGDATVWDLPEATLEGLKDVLVYVMPRMSPDGAERILKSGRWVRSLPLNDRDGQAAPQWVHGDMDGDGLALTMRVADPAGEYVDLEGCDGALRPRRVEDVGPFYKLFPEGHIAGFDGLTIPDPHGYSDNSTDLNRNFPVDWQPEPNQPGAGRHALSAPESAAVVRYTANHPEIFAWLNLHCFGGVVIRPLGDGPDTDMHPDELALYKQLEQWNTDFVGYPTVSGYEEFTYAPGKPLKGDIVAWAYKARGAFAWVVELWDLFAQIGMERPKRFVDLYTQLDGDHLTKLWQLDRAENGSQLFKPWVDVDHPQLGPVQVGGFDPRVGMWNPPLPRINGICVGLSRVMARVAAMAPRLVVSSRLAESGDTTTVGLVVENLGYLPTYVLASKRELNVNEPLFVELTGVSDGLTVLAPQAIQLEVGHLEGWGRGRFHGAQSLIFPRGRGTSNRHASQWVTQGQGTLTFRIGSCRTGWQTHAVSIG
jgi:hypothetical protein